MDQDTNSITHAKFRMWLRPDGIVQIVWFPHTLVALADANAAVEGLAKVGGGKPRALLVDMRDTGAEDRATRAAWTMATTIRASSAVGYSSARLARLAPKNFTRQIAASPTVRLSIP